MKLERVPTYSTNSTVGPVNPLVAATMANRCQLSKRAIRRWISAGELPVYRLGHTDLRTAEKHYNQACMNHAVREYQRERQRLRAESGYG